MLLKPPAPLPPSTPPWATHQHTRTPAMADQHEVDLDSIIDRLLEVRGSRPGKQVQLLESEIRFLCTKAREIFISQPILLELEAPIKVCRNRSMVKAPSASNGTTHRDAELERLGALCLAKTSQHLEGDAPIAATVTLSSTQRY